MKVKNLFLTMVLSLLIAPMMVSADGNVAKIDNATFTDLNSAITAAEDGDTITLLANATVTSGTKINKDITLDLNGFDVTSTNRVFIVQNANFNVVGEGTIKETAPDYAPITVKGSNVSTDEDYTVVTIGKDVTLIGWAGVFITPYASTGAPYAYGVEINLNGTINAVNDSGDAHGIGVYINGQIQDKVNAPVINISSTATITSTGVGIYAGGYGTFTIGAANISGVESGLGIKSGKVTLNGTTVTGTGVSAIPTSGNNNGIEASGAAIQLESNTGYAGGIELTINGGTYTSTNAVAVYEYMASGTETSVSSISITSGTFVSASAYNNLMFSDSFVNTNKGFITGGNYSTDPSAYVATGYKSASNGTSFDVSEVSVPTGTHTITGTVTNGNNATVQLKQGGVVIQSVEASDTGAYEFTDVAKGLYNVVAISGEDSTMQELEVNEENATLDLVITAGTSTSVVVSASTPDVVISNLEEEGKYVVLYVSADTANADSEEQAAIVAIDSTKTYEFYSFDLEVDGTISKTTNGVVKIAIPYDFSGKNKISISRFHEGEVNVFTELAEMAEEFADGTFYADKTNGYLYIFTDKFSEYAVGYTPDAVITNPKTGDGIVLYFGLGLMSVIGLFFVAKKSKKAFN